MEYSYSIADDHKLFRIGFAKLFDHFDELGPIKQYDNGKDLVADLDREEHRIIFLDIDMPEQGGVETLEILNAEYPNCRVIILSMHSEEEFISYMMENGASGYLLKNIDTEEVRVAVESVKTTGYYFTEMVSKAMLNKVAKNKIFKPQPGEVELTKREVEILKLICEEMTTLEISEKLFISKRTVEGHRNNMLTKTGRKNTAGLVVYALKKGILEV